MAPQYGSISGSRDHYEPFVDVETSPLSPSLSPSSSSPSPSPSPLLGSSSSSPARTRRARVAAVVVGVALMAWSGVWLNRDALRQSFARGAVDLAAEDAVAEAGAVEAVASAAGGLSAEAELSGITKMKVVKSVNAGDMPLALECPHMFTIHAVGFASFGTPKQNLDTGVLEVDETCNVANSVEIVENQCIGLTSCDVPATVEHFGGTDPCPGTAKRLYVQATCGKAEGGTYAYKGCYADESHAMVSHWTETGTTYDECLKLARNRHANFFVMEPIAGSADGLANCGMEGEYNLEGKMDDGRCEDAKDADGRLFGGEETMAVYELATYHSEYSHAWAVCTETEDGEKECGPGAGANVGWSACAAGCGTSTKYREIVCIRSDSIIVDDTFCDADERPDATAACTSYATCTFEFRTGGFGPCDPGCGESAMWQDVNCVRVDLDEVTEDKNCLDAGQFKPPIRQPCFEYSTCHFTWMAKVKRGETKDILFQGGHAIQELYHWVPAMNTTLGYAPGNSSGIYMDYSDYASGRPRPIGEAWLSGGFIQCDASCGSGVSHRELECMRTHSAIDGTPVLDEKAEYVDYMTLPDFFVNNNCITKPVEKEECFMTHGCEYFWRVEHWSECEAECAKVGARTREVACRRSNTMTTNKKDVDVINVDVEDENCVGVKNWQGKVITKPNSTEVCTNNAHCKYGWHALEWSECPAYCGYEQATRNVWCEREDGKLETERNCARKLLEKNRTCAHVSHDGVWSNDRKEPCEKDEDCGDIKKSRCHPSHWYGMIVGLEAKFVDWGTKVLKGTWDPGVEEKPPIFQKCASYELCGCIWEDPLPWHHPSIECSVKCGVGIKTRTTYCKIASETSPFYGEECPHESTDARSCEAISDPDWLQTPCFAEEGCCYEYGFTEWGECTAACGHSDRGRTVYCDRREVCGDPATSVGEVMESFCAHIPKTQMPMEIGDCFSDATCDYAYDVLDWGQCLPACGVSSRSRDLICVRSDGTEVEHEYCSRGGGDVPDTTSSCMSYETCTYAWHLKQGDLGTCYDNVKNGDEVGVDCGGSCPDCVINGGWSDFGDWSACSASCGNGVQRAMRLCNNPAPQNGGRDCIGEPFVEKRCHLKTCEVEWGDRCSYTTNEHHLQILVSKGEPQKLTQIAKHKSHVFLKLKSTADVDLSLQTRKGRTLVSYSGPNVNWGDSDFIDEETRQHIIGCTDDCAKDLNVTFNGDGLVHHLYGDESSSSEWIYVEETNDLMYIYAHGYEDGKGVVTYEYDCPPDCEVCIGVTEEDQEAQVAAAESATENSAEEER